MSIWNDYDSQLEQISECQIHTTKAQLAHRMMLADFWGIRPGDHVLEVGCGQGDTTVVLAEAVGDDGHVVGIDTASGGYGAPTTIGDAHAFTKSSRLGGRIEYRLQTDLLNGDVDFPSEQFDMVVFSMASWNMSSPSLFAELLAKVRPWARRLGYAEWDPRIQQINQVPHLVAVLVHLHFRTVWPKTPRDTISSLILPKMARSMAESGGWRIREEKVEAEVSSRLDDGKSWEMTTAMAMIDWWGTSRKTDDSSYPFEVISSEVELLADLSGLGSDDRARSFIKENASLPTYAFVAE